MSGKLAFGRQRIQARHGVTYSIYALSDPRVNGVRYVGVTLDLEGRVRAHMAAGSHRSNQGMADWCADLRRAGLDPTVKVLESITIPSRCAPCGSVPYAREGVWISALWHSGEPLLNKDKLDYLDRKMPRIQLSLV